MDGNHCYVRLDTSLILIDDKLWSSSSLEKAINFALSGSTTNQVYHCLWFNDHVCQDRNWGQGTIMCSSISLPAKYEIPQVHYCYTHSFFPLLEINGGIFPYIAQKHRHYVW